MDLSSVGVTTSSVASGQAFCRSSHEFRVSDQEFCGSDHEFFVIGYDFRGSGR